MDQGGKFLKGKDRMDKSCLIKKSKFAGKRKNLKICKIRRGQEINKAWVKLLEMA